MKKNIVILLLVVCMVMGLVVPVYATNNVQFESRGIDVVTKSRLKDIPVFLTMVPDGTKITEEEKSKVSNFINNKSKGNVQDISFQVISCIGEQKDRILTSPIYKETLEKVATLLDNGVTVKYMNFFVPKTMLLDTTRAKEDDPSYWEGKCPALGTYNGYKFLYLESSIGVETSEVTPKNLSGSLNWVSISKKSLEVILDHYVKNNYYKAVKAVSNSLSTLFNIYNPPISVTYSSSNGYVKAKVSGDVYTRTILIRDDKDRVKGYAYYNWGTTQRLSASLRVDAKYPFKKNASGTYEYARPSYTYPTQNSNTPGYYGNATLYKSIINLYNNTTGYFTHGESIDIQSAVASLLG